MKNLTKNFVIIFMGSLFLVISCKKEEATPITPPALTAGVATNITGNTATVSGGVTVVGSQAVSDYGIVYGTSTTPTLSDSKMSLGALSTPKSFTTDLSGLTQNTDYSFRTYVINSGGTVYGSVATFKTLELKAPTSTTGIASAITTTGFAMDGKITDVGTASVTEFGHCISATNQMPTVADTKTSMGATAAAKDFKSVFTALIAGTSYFVRSYATNAVGTSYGDKVEVKTLPLVAPTVTTGLASAVLAASATMAGSVKTVGTDNITQYGHVWSATNATPTTADSKTSLGALATAKDYTSALTSLTAGTTYNVRSYATNSVGTAYGDVVTFKTISAELPTVTTYSASNILSTSAKIDGQIGKSGTTAVTQYGHVWSTTNQTPTIADSKTTLTAAGTYPLNYTSDMTGLSANSTYYVRAYATSTSGTSYSPSVSTFKTGVAGDDLNTFNDLTVTILKGANYSKQDQTLLFNATEGKFYKVADGAANAANIDFIFTLFSNNANGDDVLIFSPARFISWDKFWGNLVTIIGDQNWSIYKATKIGTFNTTNYPQKTWWDKLNSATDISTLIAKDFTNITSNYFTLMNKQGTVNDNNIYVFQTRAGKYGIMRVTDGGVKPTTESITFDIKVQK